MEFVEAAEEPGLDRAGLAQAQELLGSASQAIEVLAAKIRSCDDMYSCQQRWAPRCGEVAADLEVLRICALQIWGISLDTDAGDKALVLQARDATYLIEDLQDIIEYRRLESGLATRRAKVRGRRFKLLSVLMFCGGSTKPLKFIDFVTQEKLKLVNLLNGGTGPALNPPQPLPLHSGTLLPKQHKVIGRDKERDEVVRILTEPATKMTLLSIVGTAGVGKTMLAQLVFNDPRVDQHFDVTSWVSVSRKFDKMELTSEILRSAQPAWDGSAEDLVGFQMLQSELRQFVATKRCLIVLDGVCEDARNDHDIWQDILTPLQAGDTGSRILLTSRANTVPPMLAGSQSYTLHPLDRHDCWALLKEHTLGSDSNDVLRMISEKTNGLPLAAKLVAGALGATGSTNHWMNITETEPQENAVFPALRLGYKFLPACLKRCLAYCSMFPHNWKFDPANLICLWIAEGFVQPQNTAEKRMEDTAREYFDQLLSRSFFEELKLGSKIYYQVNDIVHDLAQSVAAGDCFRIEDGMSPDIPSTVRHLSVSMNSLDDLTSPCRLEKLRTLLIQRSLLVSNYSEEDLIVKFKNLLVKSKNLRVLDVIGFNLEELPQSIGDLLHLRYLSIRGSVQRLPESIGKLLHLQTLCFPQNSSFVKLPAGISMLVNLRHLDVETKFTAELVGIRRLGNLQGSLEFHVEKREGRTLEELRNINGLRGSLKIKGLENVSNNEEACKAELGMKIYLCSLTLEWSTTSRNIHPPADLEVLEGLQPHPDIKNIRIRRYCGTGAPRWLRSPSLQLLRSLHLINCRSMGILPPLGHLPSLRYLHMKEMCAIDRIGQEFYGTEDVAFPSLSVLEFEDFPRLREWSGLEGRNSFPCLERLFLMDCPELIKIPSFLPITREITIERTRLVPYMRLAPFSSVSEKLQLDVCTSAFVLKGLLHEQHIESIAALNISGVEQVVAAEQLGSLVSLQKLQLSNCNLTDQAFSRFLQALPCLSSLEITDLPNITSLPGSETLEFCTKLTELRVRNCQLLRSLSLLQFFVSLKYLVIERCPKVTAASFPVNFCCLSSLNVLRILYCSDLQSLPVCGLPSSLETLHIIGCHPELSRQTRNREGLYFQKLATIPKVLIQ